LTSCSHTVEVQLNDEHHECHQVAPPQKPYTDKKVGVFITKQSGMIDTCSALLGNKPSE
jgi:hypothetical protein